MFNTPTALAIALGVSTALILIGVIIFPTGAATLCSRYATSIDGRTESCYTCSSNQNTCANAGCGGLQGTAQTLSTRFIDPPGGQGVSLAYRPSERPSCDPIAR